MLYPLASGWSAPPDSKQGRSSTYALLCVRHCSWHHGKPSWHISASSPVTAAPRLGTLQPPLGSCPLHVKKGMFGHGHVYVWMCGWADRGHSCLWPQTQPGASPGAALPC